MAYLPKSWRTISMPNQYLQIQIDRNRRALRPGGSRFLLLRQLSGRPSTRGARADYRGFTGARDYINRPTPESIAPWHQLVARRHQRAASLKGPARPSLTTRFGSSTIDIVVADLCRLRDELKANRGVESAGIDIDDIRFAAVRQSFALITPAEILGAPAPTLLKMVSVFDFFQWCSPGGEAALVAAANEHLTALDGAQAFELLRSLKSVANMRASRGVDLHPDETLDYFRITTMPSRLQSMLPRWVQWLTRRGRHVDAVALAAFVYQITGSELKGGATVNMISDERCSQWFVFTYYRCGFDDHFLLALSQKLPPPAGGIDRKPSAVKNAKYSVTPESVTLSLRHLLCMSLSGASDVIQHSLEHMARRQRASRWVSTLAAELSERLSDAALDENSSPSVVSTATALLSVILEHRSLLVFLAQTMLRDRTANELRVATEQEIGADPRTVDLLWDGYREAHAALEKLLHVSLLSVQHQAFELDPQVFQEVWLPSIRDEPFLSAIHNPSTRSLLLELLTPPAADPVLSSSSVEA